MAIRLFFFIMLFNFNMCVYSADIPFEFEQAEQQQRYQNLIEEIRCLVCQNQSLADSHAGLAQDLRLEIYEMISSGKDDQEITRFLVERYGDFVLFRPPMKSSTWLLWFAPFIFLLIAIVAVVYFVRAQAAAMPPELNEGDSQKLTDIAGDIKEEKS